MNKLKMLALAVVAAATVGIGALAAAPSASAAKVPDNVCKALSQAAEKYNLLAAGTPGWVWPLLHWYYVNKAANFNESWILLDCA